MDEGVQGFPEGLVVLSGLFGIRPCQPNGESVGSRL